MTLAAYCCALAHAADIDRLAVRGTATRARAAANQLHVAAAYWLSTGGTDGRTDGHPPLHRRLPPTVRPALISDGEQKQRYQQANLLLVQYPSLP